MTYHKNNYIGTMPYGDNMFDVYIYKINCTPVYDDPVVINEKKILSYYVTAKDSDNINLNTDNDYLSFANKYFEFIKNYLNLHAEGFFNIYLVFGNNKFISFTIGTTIETPKEINNFNVSLYDNVHELLRLQNGKTIFYSGDLTNG